jgi:hypothetical protein
MKVSLSATPVVLKEQDETTLTLTFRLSEPPPPEGINVIVDSDVADAIREFDVGGIEIVGGKFPDPNLDASGFEFLITAQTASIKIPVLNDSEVEPTETIQFKLQPGAGYTIDPAADQATLSLIDSPSAGKNVVALQLIPYTFDGDDKLVASALSKSPEDGTSLLSFVFTADGEIPKDGLIVNIDSTVQMRDYFAFLAEKPFIVGGELVGAIFNDAGEATGFKFRMTQPQAILNLRVDADGSKTNEKVNFVVAPGDYSIDAKTRLTSVTFYESLAQVPLSEAKTLFGSDADDILTGGDSDDIIYGNGGKDTLIGGNGNDLIYGGDQADVITSGNGNDTIYANGGGDTIDTGIGLDTIWLGSGTATVKLNAGEGYVTVKNFQLGVTKFTGVSGLTYTDSADGVKISKGDDLLAIATWQTASTFSNNAAMIFI